MTIRLRNVCIILGITIAVYLGMKYFLPLIVPFLIAYLIVMGINPFVEWMHKKLKISKSLGASILILAAAAILCFILKIFLVNIIDQIKHFISNWELYQSKLIELMDNCCSTLEKSFGIQAENTKVFLLDNLENMFNSIKDNLLMKVMNNTISYFSIFLKFFGALVITFISVVLLQKDYNKIRDIGKENFYYIKIRRVAKGVLDAGGTYLKAQLIIMAVIAAMCVAGLMLLKNPYALILGLLIGILDAFPVFGTGTVFVPWALIKILQGDFLQGALLATIWGVTCLTREFLEPKLIGKKLGIYPIAVIMTIYIGLYVYGISGFLLGPLSLLLVIEISKEAGLLNSKEAEVISE